MRITHFDTWIGSSYFEKLLCNKRILILGESHYGDGDADKSVQLIEETINGNFSHSFYTKIALSFLEENAAADLSLKRKQFFWNAVAYNNFVQEHLDASRQSPSNAMWERGRQAFYEILQETKPDFVFVCGYRLWEQLPKTHQQIQLKTDGYHIANYNFEGVNANCLRIKHPSSNYSSQEVYGKVKELFVNNL
ncbi:MAG: hypothetical protein CVU08_06465 [Bacteroidetes bacterium HGW-Bacteroidetes-3]|jgi:hypothetical protein|nr:MAG: hypothetical protein CVU08_06465 [Bacteroidetes bacterium HGW-Bacteroidetes-3]